jgi:hypothetical protein
MTYTDYEKSKMKDTIYIMFDLLKSNKFEEIDLLLKEYDLEKDNSILVTITLLRTTYPIRSYLPSWMDLLRAARIFFHNDPAVFVGLPE